MVKMAVSCQDVCWSKIVVNNFLFNKFSVSTWIDDNAFSLFFFVDYVAVGLKRGDC